MLYTLMSFCYNNNTIDLFPILADSRGPHIVFFFRDCSWFYWNRQYPDEIHRASNHSTNGYSNRSVPNTRCNTEVQCPLGNCDVVSIPHTNWISWLSDLAQSLILCVEPTNLGSNPTYCGLLKHVLCVNAPTPCFIDKFHGKHTPSLGQDVKWRLWRRVITFERNNCTIRMRVGVVVSGCARKRDKQVMVIQFASPFLCTCGAKYLIV